MRKISRFGAAALALALSVTFVAPVTANASKASTATTLKKQNGSVDDDFVTKNVNRVAGPFNTSSEAKKYGEEKGWYDGHWVDGYYNIHTSENGKYVYYITYTTYTNTLTGATSTDSDDFDDEAKAAKFATGVRIIAGETTYLKVPLVNGDVNVKNVKSSKKSVVTAKRFTKLDLVTNTNYNANIKEETVNDVTTYYYYTSVGDKIVLGDSSNSAAVETRRESTNGSEADVYLSFHMLRDTTDMLVDLKE